MQMIGRSDAFQSDDGGIIGHAFHLEHAGARELAVEDDAAGAAVTLFTAQLHAGKLQLVAQDVGKRIFRIDKHLTTDAVDKKGFDEHGQLLLRGIQRRGGRLSGTPEYGPIREDQFLPKAQTG